MMKVWSVHTCLHFWEGYFSYIYNFIFMLSCRFQKHTLLWTTVYAGYVLTSKHTWDLNVFPVEAESWAESPDVEALMEISKTPLCFKASSKPYRRHTSEHECWCAPKNFLTECAAGNGRLQLALGSSPRLFDLSLIQSKLHIPSTHTHTHSL